MLPNIVIIGALKCGTTSLFSNLAAHPEVIRSSKRELDFFNEDRNWSKGIGWYADQFGDTGKVRVEASPHYTCSPPEFQRVLEPEEMSVARTARRMHSVIPDAKLVYIVRDPIARIVSNYHHARIYLSWGEARNFEEVVSCVENNPYIEGSRYWRQLQRYLQHYRLEDIHLMELEELSGNPRKAMLELSEFLRIDPSFYRHFDFEPRNRTESKRYPGRLARRGYSMGLPKLAPAWFDRAVSRVFPREIPRIVVTDDTRSRLVEALSDDTRKLRELTGRKFESWSL